MDRSSGYVLPLRASTGPSRCFRDLVALAAMTVEISLGRPPWGGQILYDLCIATTAGSPMASRCASLRPHA